ncbi:ParA family protein [Alkalibacillus haloalkaliphilus]|uniref:ParA family protein n=1 Tax=Alkalibacillus haloalkaliphilus TaxID=94136 RepID=UPI0029364349|nr:ParA family protein [Alkalibacillus haloalkaliphilus]MDV2581405.1 ParA family protein [Alkalibacillus haloalkaliphilus]
MTNPKNNVISFLNMKGGVGKTTLCLSLAYQLTNDYDKKILIIDMDPQFNATQTMMEQYNLINDYLDDYREKKTVKRIFDRKQTLAGSVEEESVEPDEIIISSDINSNLDIICGNIDLIFEDKNQDSVSKKRLDIFLKKHNLRNEYDFIFIDCPPTISFFTDASLIASDHYLIPVKIDKFSTLGVKMLDNVVGLMKEDPDFRINCLGIIYTLQEDQKKLEGIREVFEENSIVSRYNIFDNGMKKHNHLLSGERGNIAYNYEETKGDMLLICNEFLFAYEQVGEPGE